MAAAKFRETMWFKRGELAAARAGSVEAEERHEERQEDRTEARDELLPIEDRYLEDGTLSPGDSMTFGVHTGRTTAMARISTGSVDTGDIEAFLVDELTDARRVQVAMIGLAAALAAVVVLCLAL